MVALLILRYAAALLMDRSLSVTSIVYHKMMPNVSKRY